MQDNGKQLRLGVVLSYVNLAISSLIPFFYTPIMLRMLGQAEYGLYSLSNSVTAYLSLLSFGFGTTIVRYIAKYRAEKNQEAIERTFGLFFMVYCALAVLVLAVGVFLAENANGIFAKGLQANEIVKMKTLVVIMSFNCALSFPNSVFSSMIIAHERYIYRKLLDVLSTVLLPCINLAAMYMGFASVGLALAETLLQVILVPANVLYCFRNLNLRLRFGGIEKPVILEMLGFSAFAFIGTIVDMLFWATDKVILGMLAGTAAVAVYNIGGTFNNIIMSLSSSISGVLTPKIVGMVTTNRPASELTELTIRVGRLQFIIIALAISGFTVFGQAFIALWAGPEYRDAYWIALLTLYPLCVPLIQSAPRSIITAMNKHQFRSVLYLIIAVINVVSTYLTVPYMGAIGAAVCTGVSYIVGHGIIMNIYYYKVTGVNIPLFWRNILKMAVIPAAMAVAGLLLKNRYIMTDWLRFFIGVAVYSVVYFVLMAAFALDDYEKNMIGNMLGKVLPFFRKNSQED